MTTLVIKEIKASGGFSNNMNDFAYWIAQQDLVALDITVECHVFIDQAGAQVCNYQSFAPLTSDATHKCIVRPAPGYGVNDLDTGNPLDYGTVGVELTINDAGYRFPIGIGTEVTGFRINCASASNGNIGIGGSGDPALRGGPILLRRNRIKHTAGSYGIICGGYPCEITENILIADGVVSGPLVHAVFHNVKVDRNAVVARNGATGPFISTDYGNENGTIQNNMFRDCGNVVIDRASGWSAIANNFGNVALTTPLAGLTINTGANALTRGNADQRPTASGPLIGAANGTANSINDLYGRNRGTAPDVGAYQLTAAPALPTAVVTSQVVSGQNVTISGTTTGSPTSAIATIPAASTPNGATSQGPLSVTLGAGTFTVTFPAVPAGSYAAPVVTVTNAGGPAMASGASSFEVLGVDGTPTGPGGGTDTTPPTLTLPTAASSTSTTATGTVTTNEANGTLYRLIDTSATATDTAVKAGSAQAVTTLGLQSVSFTGLSPSTTYFAHYLHRDAAGNDSTVSNSASFATPAGGDVTAPTLTSPTGAATSAATASGTVSTNEGNGTLYFCATVNATESAATVKAAASQSVSATGVQTVAVTGLAPASSYYLHYLHRDAAGNDSAVANSLQFTTPAVILGVSRAAWFFNLRRRCSA